MERKIQFIFECIWTAIVMFTMPFCLGIIYMDITGHSKGYDYDLGSEIDISIIMGIIELILWSILAISSMAALYKKVVHVNKKYLFFMVTLMVLLFIGGICFMGGWYEFIRCFGVA